MFQSKHSFSMGLLFALSVTATVSQAHEQVFSSGSAQVQLIELYTSEGCSSCPPADRRISQLKADSGLWQRRIPIAFHVDYWDYIGWQDPFAHAANSQRQRTHAKVGNVSSVYTPGFIVDGQEWSGFFRGKNLPALTDLDPGPLTLNYEDGKVTVEFQPTNSQAQRLKLQLAWLGSGLETAVTAGENAGRKLQHDFVVLKRQQEALFQQQNYKYAGDFPAEELAEAEQYALVAWLEDQRGRPVQAVGGWAIP